MSEKTFTQAQVEKLIHTIQLHRAQISEVINGLVSTIAEMGEEELTSRKTLRVLDRRLTELDAQIRTMDEILEWTQTIFGIESPIDQAQEGKENVHDHT